MTQVEVPQAATVRRCSKRIPVADVLQLSDLAARAPSAYSRDISAVELTAAAVAETRAGVSPAGA